MYRLFRIAAAFVCALSFTALASTTGVTATLTDSDGILWANCSWSAVISSQYPLTIGGVPVPDSSQRASGTCNNGGVLTSTMLNTSSVQQSNVTWTFTIQPNASVPPLNITGIAVTGSSIDLSSALSAGLKAPRFSAGPNAYGYADVEVNFPSLGATYFNTGTLCGSSSLRQYSQAGWQCGGGSNASIIPGAQVLYLPYKDGTGTILTDQSGNGRNCTFGGGGSAPTWILNGAALRFEGNYCTFSSGVLNGAKTIQMWFAPIAETDTAPQVFLSDSAGNTVSRTASANGLMYSGVSGGTSDAAVDRYVSNTSYALTIPASGNPIQYINGRQASGYISNNAMTWTSAGTGSLGDYAGSLGSYPAGMILYAMVVYPTALTSTQISQNDVSVKNLLTQNGVADFSSTQSSKETIVTGDSIYANQGGGFARSSSPPFLILSTIGVTQYSNLSLSGQTQAQINSAITAREFPVSDQFNGGSRLFLDNAGTNDIRLGTSGASTFTLIQSYCSSLHSRYPGSSVVVSTIMPRADNTTAQEAQREALNTALTSAWVGGTLGCDGLNDVANNPIVATLVTPNAYQPSAAGSFNATYSSDGIHPLPITTATMTTQGAASVLDAQGLLKNPFWVKVAIPYPVLATFALTSQVLPILQLGPTWQVCGVKSAVSSAFVGTSISALTVSIGDSTGTATQYTSPQSLLSTTSSMLQNNTFVSAHGIVQGTFTSTGANLSALTAGNLNVDVCVVSAP